jgi:5'-3' exonuclease
LRRRNNQKNLETLVVDGDALLKRSFFGAKNVFNEKKEHIGGLYQFINILRKTLSEKYYNKVVVFWDGVNGNLARRKIYPNYKTNRKKSSNYDSDAFLRQKLRTQQYLEELYIRQYVHEDTEADDLIAEYCINKKEKEIITIYTADRDLVQLINEKVRVFLLDKKELVTEDTVLVTRELEYLPKNVCLIKILLGDASDNILGIKGLSPKRLGEISPELKSRKVNLQEIKDIEYDGDNWRVRNVLNNIKTGTSNGGVFGDELYEINNKIISLEEPFIDEDIRKDVKDLVNLNLDPSGRDYKNVIKMMIEDGLVNVIPASYEDQSEFLIPFITLKNNETKNGKDKK